MPPRKSDQPRHSADDSALGRSPAADESQVSVSAPERKDKDKDKEREKDAVTIEDLTLPKSIITRLAKGVLPPNTQIQANAILAMSKSATVFINYLASHANANTMNAGKKTIAPADVFKALDEIEFSFLKDALEAEFAKFNQIQTEKRTNYRQKVRAKHDGPVGDDTEMADTTAADTTIASETGTGGAPPRAKKARVEPAAEGGDEDDAETEEEAEVEAHEEEEDEEDEGDEEAEEDDDAEEARNGSGDETQDALEERPDREDGDEALDGDESD